MPFSPTGQCTGIGVKEVGDDAPRWDARLRGNRRPQGKPASSSSEGATRFSVSRSARTFSTFLPPDLAPLSPLPLPGYFFPRLISSSSSQYIVVVASFLLLFTPSPLSVPFVPLLYTISVCQFCAPRAGIRASSHTSRMRDRSDLVSIVL